MISNISFLVSHNEAILGVYFNRSSTLPGSIYCYLDADSIIPSILTSTIFNAGVSSAFYAGESYVELTVTNLIAYQKYVGYCGVKLVENKGVSTDRQILATQLKLTTLCCRAITFSSSNPSFIYNDSSVYGATSDLVGKNIFKIAVVTLPSSPLIITPILYDLRNKSINSDVACSPSSKLFAANSSSTTFSFSLWPTSLLTGKYRLSLQISGIESVAYQVPNVWLSVLSIQSPPMTPSISSARMSDSGSGVFILFDSNTNYGGLSSTSSWLCSELLSFDGSRSSTCNWINRTAIYAALSVSSSVVPTSLVTLKGGIIKASCTSVTTIVKCSDYDSAAPQSVSIRSPWNGIVPEVILQMPSEVSGCDAVTIDPTATTGNGGRSWTSVKWKIFFGNGTSASSITAYMKSVLSTGSIVTIPSSMLEARTYYVTLTVTNFLGKSASRTASFSYGADSNIPSVKIGGSSSLMMKSSAGLELFASTELSSCASLKRQSTIKYEWKVNKVAGAQIMTTPLKSTSKSDLRFYLPAYSLSAGSLYQVQFIASALASNGFDTVTSSASVSITVSVGALVARIYGGSVRYITSNETLDASYSYDEDASDSSLIQYAWYCEYASGNGYGESCNFILGSQSLQKSTLNVPYSSLNSSLIYTIGVVITNAAGTKSSSSTVTINKVETTSAYATATLLTSTTVVNEDAIMRMDAQISSNKELLVIWQAFIDGVEQPLSNQLSVTNRSLTTAQVSSSITYPLVLPSFSFTGGTIISIRVSTYMPALSNSIVAPTTLSSSMLKSLSTSSSTYKLMSYSEISLRVNSPPSSGKLSVTPNSGTALNTTFVTFTYDWVEDATDLPLSYDFRYSVAANSYLFMQSRGAPSASTAKLPVGQQSTNYNVTLVVRAYDIYLACSNATVIAQVKPSLSVQNYKLLLSSLLDTAIIVGSIDQTVSIINAVSSTMNTVDCSGVNITFCSGLNRSPCTLTSNTCGSCNSDYVGKVGDANTLCFPSSEPGKGIGATCSKGSECLYGTCTSGTCVAPTQSCPIFDNQECGGHGICQYLIGGLAVVASKCSILDTACIPTCKCNGGYGGKDCSLDPNTLAQREGARMTMCETLTNATASSDTSIALIDSLSSSILSTYDKYEVTSENGIYSCASSLNSIVSAMFEGSYLDMTSSSTSAQNLVETISEFVVAGNASFLGNITSSLVQTALSSMAKGQTSVELTSENLKLKLSRDLSTSLNNNSISAPLTDTEKSYGTQPVSVALTGNVEAMCDDGSGYVSLSIGAWSNSPFANASVLKTSLFRSESVVQSDNALSESSISADVAYFLVFPFTQIQELSSLSIEEKNLLDSYNETLPSCTKYNQKNELVSCNSCNVSSFSNISVTFACYDMAELCKSTSTVSRRRGLQSVDDTIQTESVEEVASLVYQTAALVSKIESTISTTLSFNVFAIDLQRSKAVLSFVGTLLFIFFVGSCFFYRWDTQDKANILYLKQREKCNEVPAKEPSHFVAQKLQKENSMSKRMVAHVMESRSTQLNSDLIMLVRQSIPLKISTPVVDGLGKSLYYNFIKPLVDNHEYILMFGRSSLSNTRLLRWVYLSQQLFFALFIDTLFFSIFFADDGTCESFLSKETCTAELNPITSQSMCLWSEEAPSRGTYEFTCSLNPPPESTVFVVMLSAVTMLLTVPLGTIFDYVKVEVCAMRPDFSVFGWSNLYWIGGSSTSRMIKNVDRQSHNNILSKEEEEIVTRRQYLDALPVGEETNKALTMWVNEIKDPKEGFLSIFDIAALGKVVKTFTGFSLDYWITDGISSPSAHLKAQGRLLSARIQSNRIVEQLTQSAEDEQVDLDKEVLQFFILENLPAYQRFALKSQCFVHEHISPPTIDGRLWIAGWFFMIGSVLFFNYWVLTWALSSGSRTFSAWAVNYGVGVLQEVVMIQFFRVYFLYIATMTAIVPRLQAIQSVLESIVVDISKRQKQQLVKFTDSSPFTESTSYSTCSLVQHFSATCRAARSKLLVNRLSGWLLIQLNDVDVYKVKNPMYKLELGVITMTILAIPVLVSSVVSDSMADSVFEQLFPTIMTSIFVGFCVLLANSLQIFIIVLIVVVLVATFRSFVTSMLVRYKLWNYKMKSVSNVCHNHFDDDGLPLTLVSQNKDRFRNNRFSFGATLFCLINQAFSWYSYTCRVLQQMIHGIDIETQRVWRGMNYLQDGGIHVISSPITSKRLESICEKLSPRLLTDLPMPELHCRKHDTMVRGTYIERTMSNQLALMPNAVKTNSFIVLGLIKLEKRSSRVSQFHFDVTTKKDVIRYCHYIQCFHETEDTNWTKVITRNKTSQVDSTIYFTKARSRVAFYDFCHRESCNTIDLILRGFILHCKSNQESKNLLTTKQLMEVLPKIHRYLSVSQPTNKKILSSNICSDLMPLYENNKRKLIGIHISNVYLSKEDCISMMRYVQALYSFHHHHSSYGYLTGNEESFGKIDVANFRLKEVIDYQLELEEILLVWLSTNKRHIKTRKRRYASMDSATSSHSIPKLDSKGGLSVPLNQFILWLERVLVYQKRILANIDAAIVNKSDLS